MDRARGEWAVDLLEEQRTEPQRTERLQARPLHLFREGLRGLLVLV